MRLSTIANIVAAMKPVGPRVKQVLGSGKNEGLGKVIISAMARKVQVSKREGCYC